MGLYCVRKPIAMLCNIVIVVCEWGICPDSHLYFMKYTILIWLLSLSTVPNAQPLPSAPLPSTTVPRLQPPGNWLQKGYNLLTNIVGFCLCISVLCIFYYSMLGHILPSDSIHFFILFFTNRLTKFQLYILKYIFWLANWG